MENGKNAPRVEERHFRAVTPSGVGATVVLIAIPGAPCCTGCCRGSCSYGRLRTDNQRFRSMLEEAIGRDGAGLKQPGLSSVYHQFVFPFGRASKHASPGQILVTQECVKRTN